MSLHSLLSSYQEALDFWTKPSSIPPASEPTEDPLAELAKCTRLVKAHTTKVGILFSPDNFHKSESAATKVLQDLSEAMVMVHTVAKAHVRPAKVSSLLHNAIEQHVRALTDAQKSLADELQHVTEGHVTTDRLASVGRVWAACDALDTLISGGMLGLIAECVAQNVGMIDDGFDEFAEWAEDPQSVSFDDLDSEQSSAEEEPNDRLVEFAKKWVQNVRGIRVLVASFKTLPQSVAANVVDDVYATQKDIVRGVDEIISDLMMDSVVDDDMEELGRDLSQKAQKLCALGEKIHEDRKRAWYEKWRVDYGKRNREETKPSDTK